MSVKIFFIKIFYSFIYSIKFPRKNDDIIYMIKLFNIIVFND